jgi:DNA-binding NarL/FixJ family response regulator
VTEIACAGEPAHKLPRLRFLDAAYQAVADGCMVPAGKSWLSSVVDRGFACFLRPLGLFASEYMPASAGGLAADIDGPAQKKTGGVMTTRIVIAMDRGIVGEGLAALLEGTPELRVVGQASDGLECVHLAIRQQPDIVLMDVMLPGLNGVEATRRIMPRSPQSKAICIAASDTAANVRAVLDAGARGYLARSSRFHELLRAIQVVRAQQMYISPGLSSSLVSDYRGGHEAAVSAYTLLTSREREVVQLLSEGLSTKDIAARLHVSIKTIGTHREHIMLKLDMHSIAELTRYAIREGLSPLEQRQYIAPPGLPPAVFEAASMLVDT